MLLKIYKVKKTTPNHSVVTEHSKYELRYLRNENLTKPQIIKTITENRYLPSTSSTQSSSDTRGAYNTRLKMAHKCTIDLTENNKSKLSGSLTRDNNLQVIANSNNKKKIKRYQYHPT